MKILLLYMLLSLFSSQISSQYLYWKNISPPFDSLTQQAEEMYNREKDFESILPIVHKMYELAKGKDGNSIMLSRAIYWDARMQLNISEDSCFVLIKKAEELIDRTKNEYDYSRILTLKQVLLYNRGELLESYILADRLASYYEKIGDEFLWAYCMGNISNVFSELKEYDEALSYAEKANKIFKEYGLSEKMLLIRLNLSIVYEKVGKKEKAIKLLKPIVENFPIGTSKKIRALYLISYCNYLHDIKEKEIYTEMAYQATLSYSNSYFIQIALLNKSLLFLQKEMYRAAQNEINKVKPYLEAHPNLLLSENVYGLFSQIFAGQCGWDSAYYYSNLFKKCSDSIRRVEVLSEIQHIKVRKSIEDYRAQLAMSKLNEQRQARRTYMVWGIFIVVSSFAFVIFILLRKRAKTEAKLRKIEEREYEERLENEKLKIDSQNRELSSNTILLTKKNLVLKDLSNQISNLQAEGKLEAKISRVLKNKIESTLREDDEWAYFKLHFEKVHPDFFQKLINMFPNLTDHELRLSAYSLINLTIKQMAQMLSVSPKAIVQARYRMRKKMNLNDEDSLDDFLRRCL